MKKIKLTNSKKCAIVDDKNYDRIRTYDWFYELEFGKPESSGRVCALIGGKKVRLARFILGITDPKTIVDHWDRNPLNNLESNLRTCSQRENVYNRSGRRVSSSSGKGVDWRLTKKKWRARIQVNGTPKYLGHFDSEEEAMHAYDKAAKELFGEFAVLNFPEEK